ncbi:hypothetical protein HDU96_009469 [Phlyctochytrium bullatum]|nr:hypothetical protein HDU96_009469 [Phlyctochytrium bullatum]
MSDPSPSQRAPTALVPLLHRLLPLLEQYLSDPDNVPYPLRNPAAESSQPRRGIAPPSELRRLFPGKHGMHLPDDGLEEEAFWRTVRVTLDESVRTVSPRFLDKLYAGTDGIGQISELLAALLNTNVHVYSVSPVFTLMELTLLKTLGRLAGFTHPSGLLQPGGSASNLLALVTARSTIFPEIRTLGLSRWQRGRYLTVYTSTHGHYSIEKAGMSSGLGLDSVIKVPVHPDGRIRADLLAQRIYDDATRALNPDEDRAVPFFVNLTSGTTVFASFDDLRASVDAVRGVEQRLAALNPAAPPPRIWIHVDGSYGGPALFSETLRPMLLDGLEDVDSFCVSPHKILGLPQQCSVLVVNGRRWGKKVLWKANGLGSSYLFHNPVVDEEPDTVPVSEAFAAPSWDDNPAAVGGLAGAPTPVAGADDGWSSEGEEDGGYVYDLGDAALGCGRRADALKLFLSWSHHGTRGFAARVDLAFHHCRVLEHLILAAGEGHPVAGLTPRRPGRFELVVPPTTVSRTAYRGDGGMLPSVGDAYPPGWTPTLSVSFWCVPEVESEAIAASWSQDVDAPAVGAVRHRGSVRSFVRQGGAAAFRKVEQWTLTVHRELERRGRFMVDYMGAEVPAGEDGKTEKLPKFLRVAVSNPAADVGVMEELVREVLEIVEDPMVFPQSF